MLSISARTEIFRPKQIVTFVHTSDSKKRQNQEKKNRCLTSRKFPTGTLSLLSVKSFSFLLETVRYYP